MEKVFLKLLNMSLTAGWLVLAILLLRPLLKKAPRWVSCALWGLVALRLLLPFSIESALSLLPTDQPVPQSVVYQEPAVDTPVVDMPVVDTPVVDAPVVDTPVEKPSAPVTVTPAPAKTPVQSATTAATWVWLGGLIALLCYALDTYVELRLRLRGAVREQGNVWRSERIRTPFVLGMFRPRVYLPFGLTDRELPHVLAHEQAHIARRDYLAKPLGFLLLSVYWFNPLMWVAYTLLCRDIELACDERVVKTMVEEERRAYSTALLDCSIRRLTIAAYPLAFGEVGVKERVKHVLKYKKPAIWIVSLALVACVALTIGFFTVPKSEAEKADPPNGTPTAESSFFPTACVYLAEDSDLTLAEALKQEQGKTHIFGKKDGIGEKQLFQVGDWSIENFFCQTVEVGELPFDTKGYEDMRGWRVLDPDGADTGYRFYYPGSDMQAFSNGDTPLWFAHFSGENTCEYAYIMTPCGDQRNVKLLYAKLFRPVEEGEPLPEIDESKYITVADVFEDRDYKPVKRLYSTAAHEAGGLLSDKEVTIRVSANRFELQGLGDPVVVDIAYFGRGRMLAWENDPESALFPDFSQYETAIEFHVLAGEYGDHTGYRLYVMDDELWFGYVTMDEYMDDATLEYLYIIQ